MSKESGILENLNDEQRMAVTKTQGPVLVLAGAGSGKTRVLTRRIAYIIEEGLASPGNILAITFTNKAASQIKERVLELNQDLASRYFPWLGTIHSTCLRMLRTFPEEAGYRKNFLIYDTDDKRSVIKACMDQLNISTKAFNPNWVSYEISRAKDNLLNAKKYQAKNSNDYQKGIAARVYELYEEKMLEYNAMDFDDIIYNTYFMLLDHEHILNHFQNIFKYILIDEFQDTNIAQYKIFAMLSQKYKNLFVVGDDDQSIYSFRGANIKNILNFEKDFPDSTVIKLETNYRSCQRILDAANAVIVNNKARKHKKLRTHKDIGHKISVYEAYNENHEALYVASEIHKQNDRGTALKDMAILYRTNAQSRVFERVLREKDIRYRIYGGLSFFSRMEVKDMLAYMRVVLNDRDEASLFRILNKPRRAIGNVTVNKIQALALEENMSSYEVIANASKFPELSSAAGKLQLFYELIEHFKKFNQAGSLEFLYDEILNHTQLDQFFLQDEPVLGIERVENIKELKSSIVFQQEIHKEEEGKLLSLEEFLESSTLSTDADNEELEEDDYISMMTLHSAKGLEFKVVFLVGLEEGLFPSALSVNEGENGLEEERRLCYVGITRAMDKLYMVYTKERTKFGKTEPSIESRFLKEIPKELLDGYKKPSYGFSSRKTFSFDSYTSQDQAPTVKRGGKAIDVPGLTTAKDKSIYKELYAISDRVLHKKYGEGSVKDLYTEDGMDIIEIDFDISGMKRMVLEYAKLIKIQ